MTAQTKPLQVTVGCTLEIIKGLREVFMTGGKSSVNVREKWLVSSLERQDAGLALTLIFGQSKLRMYTAAAGKTAHPEFNLNKGDPTRSIRVRIISRPTKETP